DEHVLTDGTKTVNHYTDSGPPTETMLIAYFPRQQILTEVDVYTPGAAAHAFAADFLEDLQARNLRIQRIVPLHGAPAPFAQLVKEAASAPASTN
ncbi:MAG: hypothetical protein AB7P22_15985, partial [Vicinamibacterales bacterium]